MKDIEISDKDLFALIPEKTKSLIQILFDSYYKNRN